MYRLLIAFFLVTSGCAFHPKSDAYNHFYAHLKKPHMRCGKTQKADYFVVFLVEARHLDYADNCSLMSTLVKHPSDGSKNSDVGHAWIYIEGLKNGKKICLEGGQSGDLGYRQPKYFEGIMDLVEADHPNPISYLWAEKMDGFFEAGSGGHYPTYAAKVNLTKEQFEELIDWIHSYSFSCYSLTGTQCTTFVKRAAELVGLNLEDQVNVPINKKLSCRRGTIRLRSCDEYSEVILPSPDMLEKSLMEAVLDGKAEYALQWYKTHRPKPKRNCLAAWRCFPERLLKLWLFY